MKLKPLNDFVNERRLSHLGSSVATVPLKMSTRIPRKRAQIVHREAFRPHLLQPSKQLLTPNADNVVHIKTNNKLYPFGLHIRQTNT